MKGTESTIQTPFGTISQSGNLLIADLKPDQYLNLEATRNILDALDRLAEGKRFPLLSVVGKNTIADPESRQYVADTVRKDAISKHAAVVTTFGQQLIGNFFVAFNKPIVPTKIFSNRESALEWLQTED
ncbi:MAG: hypothetical protein H6585_04075 [Flavobacteriales bacterium]|nr:hypothetical protein [Flavobacteriales bacterium]MCB9447502.1 hypothetical protein [Flavobacteriales bacterium]